jgi:mono/diheme cytochrome c family protein
MRRFALLVSLLFISTLEIVSTPPYAAQDKPKDTSTAVSEPKIPQDQLDRKNPVPPTPEGLAAARKLYKYDCAMCHGEQGDGKGELVDSMKLTLLDWRDPAALAGRTDGELFYIISEGRGKMVSEKERASDTLRWNLVNVVRSFSKKEAAEKPAS